MVGNHRQTQITQDRLYIPTGHGTTWDTTKLAVCGEKGCLSLTDVALNTLD